MWWHVCLWILEPLEGQSYEIKKNVIKINYGQGTAWIIRTATCTVFRECLNPNSNISKTKNFAEVLYTTYTDYKRNVAAKDIKN